jgi:hypothetical protein
MCFFNPSIYAKYELKTGIKTVRERVKRCSPFQLKNTIKKPEIYPAQIPHHILTLPEKKTWLCNWIKIYKAVDVYGIAIFWPSLGVRVPPAA